MLDILFQSLCLFLPILAANQGPGFAKKWNWPLSNTPVSRRWLGENKTLAAYYMGPLLGYGVVTLITVGQGGRLAGLAMGLGAVLGDHIKSFFKRRLGKPPGSPWWPDRIDFAVGGGLAAWLTLGWVTWQHVAVIVALAWPVHYVGNKLSHKLGLRDTPD